MIDESRISAIEARISALESRRTTSASGASDTFSPDKLSEAWADKQITKLPSNWKHRDVVGLYYSALSPEEAADLAGFFQWKADKGKAEVPVRLQEKGKNAGKPWYEKDIFEAKLLRTFAANPKRNGASNRFGTSGHGSSLKHTGTPEPAHDADGVADGEFTEESTDDSIPFASSALSFAPRHLRRRSLWQKF